MTPLSTPYLSIDMARVERNILRLAEFGREHNIGIRPHTKTHKSLRMSRLQLESGAIGLTVAKTGEAEILAQTGAELLIAYPTIDEGACRRVAELAREHSIRVAIDTKTGADRLAAAARAASSAIGVIVDMDIGMHRTGVQSPQAALELAQYIDTLGGLRVDGLMCYPGHVWNSRPEQVGPMAIIAAQLEEVTELFEKGGFSTSIVSGGSTPSAYQSHLLPQITEIRPGTSIYNDMNTVNGGFCELDDCAARVVCTVVSDAVPGQIVLDGGSKTFTNDRCIPAPDSGFGYIVEYPQAKIVAFSEEHGQTDITACDSAPKVGERVTVIPNHICNCVNLHDNAWTIEADGSLQMLPIDTRGRIY